MDILLTPFAVRCTCKQYQQNWGFVWETVNIPWCIIP